MSKNKLIPELRFPEFENDGGWDLKEFSNFIKLDRGSSPRPIQEYLTQERDGVNWIKIGDTKNAVNSVIYKVDEKITAKGAEKSRRVEKGELILANSMSFGKTYELAIEGCIYDGWFVLRKYENHFNKLFLIQMLNSDYMQNQYKRLSAGGIVQNISSDIVYNSKLYHTTIQEQQKIASCLSSLDELITAHNQKLEALKAHKKGLMQNLFPQEGETVPKYRFKEFEKDGEWVECKLEDISIKIQDGTHFSPKSTDKGDFLYITSKNVKDGYIELSTAQFISKEDHENIYKRCDVKMGDVLLTKDGTIGQACVNELTIPFSLLSSVAFIRLKATFSNYFLYHLLVSHIGQKEIESQIAGQALKRITLTKINNFCFSFPTLEEQQKIASCLSSLDELITAQAEKIEQLKLHKKGLMQGLFPKLSEL